MRISTGCRASLEVVLQPRSVHQLYLGVPPEDEVWDGILLIQRIFREAGYQSELYGYQNAAPDRHYLSIESYQGGDDEVILVHYASDNALSEWPLRTRSSLILVYHSLAVRALAAGTGGLAVHADAARHQIAHWVQERPFLGAIAVPGCEVSELRNLGFAQVLSAPLPVDLNRLRGLVSAARRVSDKQGVHTILHAESPHGDRDTSGLLRMMVSLTAMCDVPVHLLLAAEPKSDAAHARLIALIEQYGLARQVQLVDLSRVENRLALYRQADLYVSLSQSSTSCLALIKAMATDLPILTHMAKPVADTLGTGGLMLTDATPEETAAVAKLILEVPRLRRKIIEGQRRSLVRYEASAVVRTLEENLQQLGLDVRLDKAIWNSLSAPDLWLLEGPFDSSYSLAIVNRGFARGLARAGELVALVSRDGPGLFAPDSAFLGSNPDIDEMVRRADSSRTLPAVTLRDQYPPHVSDMDGVMRVLSNYAWEESGFPAAWVQEFNTTLDLITVLSSYVAKVLRDNGVHVPIHVVGAGVDQMLAAGDVAAPMHRGDRPFRFLHVSSCFPRKGVDVLLAAWGTAFTQDDPVELVIKTFPNIHNRVEGEIRALQVRQPTSAAIVLINQDINAADMRALYLSADVVVCPTRGEGFGLPIAEALAMSKPVITTAYGGQNDFCNPDTAWLCDYTFAYARTHLEVPDSVWVEPDVDSLALLLREAFAAKPTERARRAEAGGSLVRARFTWDQVAQRTQSAVTSVRSSLLSGLRLPTIGVISTWNSRCGIAAYAQSLVSGIDPARVRVFASKVPQILGADESFVSRCWIEGWSDPLDELFQEVRAAQVDAVVLQFNFGFFRLAALQRLLKRLQGEGVLVFMTLHATMDVNIPGMTARLGDIRAALAQVCRLLVHSVHDLNRLKEIGLIENVALFPMGQPQLFAGDRRAVRRSLGLDGKTIVASFGYMLPNKGLPDLVRAFALLQARRRDTHLLMLNALYPVGVSEQERDLCLDEIGRLGVQDSVTLVTDFLGEATVLARLAAADVIVYPYQHTQESASAAVKMGLSSGTPVAVTPLSIFDDIAMVSHTLPGTAPTEIADGLASLLSDTARLAALAEQQRTWAAAHDWAKLSARLDGLIRGELDAHVTAHPESAGRRVFLDG
jgi:glycosyltransferase involved in cell wall biosynthesis